MAGIAAQVVAGVHLAYLVYVLLGGLLALRGLAWLWPHVVVAAWGFLGLATPLFCPLTALEKLLMEVDGQVPYPGTFIDHYVNGVVYPTAWHEAAKVVAVTVILTCYLVVAAHRLAQRRLSPR
jgi:hypothetical protein